MPSERVIEQDVNLIQSHFFKSNRAFFSFCRKLHVPKWILDKVEISRLYSIHFGHRSPRFIVKIVERLYIHGKTFYRCLLYAHYSKIRKLPRNHRFSEDQFVTGSKFIVIPAKILCLFINYSLHNRWGMDLKQTDNNPLQPLKFKLLDHQDLFRHQAYVKSHNCGIPFRRLLSDPCNIFITNLNLLPINDVTSLNELLDENFYGICLKNFNINTALLSLKLPTPSIKINGENNEYEGVKERKQNSKRARQSSNQTSNTNPSSNASHDENINQSDETTKDTLDNDLNKLKNSGSRPRRRSAYKKTVELIEPEESTTSSEVDTNNSHPSTGRRTRSTLNESEPSAKRQKIARKRKNRIIKEEIKHIDETYESTRVAAGKELLKKWSSKAAFVKDYSIFYQEKFGCQPRTPKMGWVDVDIYVLFEGTVSRGGYDVVTYKQYWKDIYRLINNTSIVSNAATTVRQHYEKLLLDFEREVFPSPNISGPTDTNMDNDAGNRPENTPNPNSVINDQQNKTSFIPRYKNFDINSILQPIENDPAQNTVASSNTNHPPQQTHIYPPPYASHQHTQVTPSVENDQPYWSTHYYQNYYNQPNIYSNQSEFSSQHYGGVQTNGYASPYPTYDSSISNGLPDQSYYYNNNYYRNSTSNHRNNFNPQSMGPSVDTRTMMMDSQSRPKTVLSNSSVNVQNGPNQ